MALQTANQFNLTPDIAGQLSQGIQGGQNIAGQFQIGRQREQAIESSEELAASKRLVNSALHINSLPDDQKLGALQQNRESIIQRGGNPADTDAGIALAEAGNFDELNQGLQGVISVGERQGLIKPLAAKPDFTLGAGQQRFDAAGNEIASVAPTADKPVTVSALDQARIDKLNAETANIGKGGSIETPALDTLVSEASPKLQEQAKAAFGLAGGGKDGVKALQKVLEGGVESERRASAPETLKANFPNADEAEIQELQAVVDSSKTTESGFKAAGQLREKQRQVKKGKVFQARAVELLDRILGANELNDVVGSIEGSDESLIPFGGQKIRGDAESEIIADIEEAGNILTADNLDIMSGVLSETDIKIISNLAGGALNRKRGEAAFKKDVAKLREKMAGQLGVLPKGVTEDDISTTMKANNLSREQVLERLGRK